MREFRGHHTQLVEGVKFGVPGLSELLHTAKESHMTAVEWSAILISGASALVSAIALFYAKRASEHAEKANQIAAEANLIAKEGKAVAEKALAFEQDRTFLQEQAEIHKDYAEAIADLHNLKLRFEERENMCGPNCRFRDPSFELATIEKGLKYLSERLKRLKLLPPSDLKSMAQLKSDLNGARAVWDVMATNAKSEVECSHCDLHPRTPLSARGK